MHRLHLTSGIWIAATCAVVAFPVFCGMVVGRLPAVAPMFRGSPQRWRVGLFWLLIAVAALFAAVAVMLGLWTSGQSVGDVGLVCPGWIGWTIIALVAILTFLAALGADPNAPPPTAMPLIMLPHSRAERLIMLFALAPIAAFCEELVYRGFALTLLSGVAGFWIANVLQAAIFGFHHGGVRQGWLAWCANTAFGFLAGTLVWWHGNLVPAMVFHFAWNASTAARPVQDRNPARSAI